MKDNTWWVVSWKGAYIGQLYVTEAIARWEWSDQEGTTFHQVRLMPVRKAKKKAKRKA
jgi:hypothetical protein